jgi:hypothetical protein
MRADVYINEHYTHLLKLLIDLRVIGAKNHIISHGTLMLQRLRSTLPSHWIQVGSSGMGVHFIEIVPIRNALEGEQHR